jgi:hypothetical protein
MDVLKWRVMGRICEARKGRRGRKGGEKGEKGGQSEKFVAKKRVWLERKQECERDPTKTKYATRKESTDTRGAAENKTKHERGCRKRTVKATFVLP